MTKTAVETRFAYIANKYKQLSLLSINSIQQLLITYIDSKDYSDKQKKQISTALGISVIMLKRHYIDKKIRLYECRIFRKSKEEKSMVKEKIRNKK